MYVLVRPGPYICGEWDFGGLPIRFLNESNVDLRSSKNENIMNSIVAYLSSISMLLDKYMSYNGGPILMI